MFEHLTRGFLHQRRGFGRRDLRAQRRLFGACCHLEERTLLAAPTLSLVSENLQNNGADIGALFPNISASGQYVAFESGSFSGTLTPAPSDLVHGLTVENDAPNVYLRNLATNTTICLSVNFQSPDTTGNDDSRYPIISADGNTVVFLSNATNLVADDDPSNNPNDDMNVFAWSSATDKLTLVTKNYQGTGPANDPDPQQAGTAENISVSANGDYIAYDSEATNLVSGENDINYTPNVYVYDLLTNKNILVSAAASGGGIGNASSDDPVISSDGSTVAYDSLASNLDPNLSSPEQFENYQVYASTLNYTKDTVAATTLVSVDPSGTTAGDGTSIAPSLSDNGQMVAFQSASDNLVNIPNGGSYNDVYVRDLATNATQLVSIDQTGDATGDSSSFAPQISGDGDHVLFYSLADDLTTTPLSAQTNVFERNLTTHTTQLASVNYEGTGGANDTSTLANQTTVSSAQQASGQISDNGQYVLFDSVATNVVSNFQQENGGSPYGTDVYLRNTVSGETTLLSHAVGTTTTGGTGISVDTDMTPSGLDVVFQSAFPGSTPDNLVSNDTSDQTQLFLAGFVSLAGATTNAATSITTAGATLNASVNPEGSATTYNFVYGTSSNLSSGTTTTTSESAGSGTSAESESAALTGLAPHTTYYFEVHATNSGGTTDGAILNFTTLAVVVTAPAATTDAATSITATGATLSAAVNPEGSATTYNFVYGTSSNLSSGTTTTTSESAGSGSSTESETAALTGLTPNTKYYFKVEATNSGGTTSGAILNFTTLAAVGTPPTATTDAAATITATGATLKASVNPKGSATTYTFIYGTSSTLSSGTTITTSESAGSGTSAESETAGLTGLAPNTKYYFKVEASNSGGTTSGAILNFTTLAAPSNPPAVTTEPAASITVTGATLMASVNPEGSSTTFSFVYGTSSNLSSGTTTTASQSAGSGTSARSESAAISGLAPGTTYYFKVQSSSTSGTAAGAILSFTTPAVIQMSSGEYTADVTAGSGQVVLTRAGDLSSTLSVVLSSPGGHEVAPFSEVVTFGPNVLSKTVSVTISSDGQPGENQTVIPLSLSSPGPGATLGATASASLVIVDTNPPLVTITSLQHPTIKVGTGKKAKKSVVLQLQFSGPVTGAGDLAAYVLESGKTKKGKTSYSKPVRLTSAVYDYPGAPPDTVTLFLGSKLNLSVPEQLTVSSSLITDSFGRSLGQSYVVQFSNKGVTIQ
jgi:hypothetical protein